MRAYYAAAICAMLPLDTPLLAAITMFTFAAARHVIETTELMNT